MAQKLPILVYHRVHADGDRTAPDDHGRIGRSDFQRQMDYLKEADFQTITHREIATWLYDGIELPDRAVAIDFDDNRLNVFENALPVLTEHGFKATVFDTGIKNIPDPGRSIPSRQIHTGLRESTCAICCRLIAFARWWICRDSSFFGRARGNASHGIQVVLVQRCFSPNSCTLDERFISVLGKPSRLLGPISYMSY